MHVATGGSPRPHSGGRILPREGAIRTWGGSDEGDFNGRGVRRENGSWGVKTEGKLAVRGCTQF